MSCRLITCRNASLTAFRSNTSTLYGRRDSVKASLALQRVSEGKTPPDHSRARSRSDPRCAFPVARLPKTQTLHPSGRLSVRDVPDNSGFVRGDFRLLVHEYPPAYQAETAPHRRRPEDGPEWPWRGLHHSRGRSQHGHPGIATSDPSYSR